MTGHAGIPRKQSTGQWWTPRFLIDALGPFDLDPCSSEGRPFATALRHIDPESGRNGLHEPWEGFVWLNPPYGGAAGRWVGKLSEHPGGGIALVSARVDGKWFQRCASQASIVCLMRGRLAFLDHEGKQSKNVNPLGSVLVGYGKKAAERIAGADLGICLIPLPETGCGG